MGKEKVHYQAPSPERVPAEMDRFIEWVNSSNDIDAVLKAAIAHLWFVSIHPFDDGNGRITRALTDMLLARSENSSKRFYSDSVSAEIKNVQKEYYEVLERTQRGNGDITDWLLWFLHCFEQALSASESTLSSVMNNKWNVMMKGLVPERRVVQFWMEYYHKEVGRVIAEEHYVCVNITTALMTKLNTKAKVLATSGYVKNNIKDKQ